MTPTEIYLAYYKAKGLKLTMPPVEPWLVAMQPYADRGLLPVLTKQPGPVEIECAQHLANVAVEAAANAKSRGGPANVEGLFRDPKDINCLCLASVLLNPGAMTPLERRYFELVEAAREDRHADAMALLDSWGKAPVVGPSVASEVYYRISREPFAGGVKLP